MSNGNGQGHVTDSPRLAALRAKLNQSTAARDAARAAITDEDREEIELRAAVARADEERRAEEKVKRDVDLDRRFDQALEAFPDAKLKKLSIVGYDETFVIKHDGKAYAKWQSAIHDGIAGKKVDRADVTRAYAAAVVIDWNGITDLGPTSLHASDLVEFLKRNPGIATAITNAAFELAGSSAEESKS